LCLCDFFFSDFFLDELLAMPKNRDFRMDGKVPGGGSFPPPAR
jgi:hypothetical protein